MFLGQLKKEQILAQALNQTTITNFNKLSLLKTVKYNVVQMEETAVDFHLHCIDVYSYLYLFYTPLRG